MGASQSTGRNGAAALLKKPPAASTAAAAAVDTKKAAEVGRLMARVHEYLGPYEASTSNSKPQTVDEALLQVARRLPPYDSVQKADIDSIAMGEYLIDQLSQHGANPFYKPTECAFGHIIRKAHFDFFYRLIKLYYLNTPLYDEMTLRCTHPIRENKFICESTTTRRGPLPFYLRDRSLNIYLYQYLSGSSYEESGKKYNHFRVQRLFTPESRQLLEGFMESLELQRHALNMLIADICTCIGSDFERRMLPFAPKPPALALPTFQSTLSATVVASTAATSTVSTTNAAPKESTQMGAAKQFVMFRPSESCTTPYPAATTVPAAAAPPAIPAKPEIAAVIAPLGGPAVPADEEDPTASVSPKP